MEPNFWTNRYSRRSALRGGALATAGLGAAALIGCGDSDESEPTSTASSGGGTAVSTSSDPATTPSAVGEGTYGGRIKLPILRPSLTDLDPHTSLYLAFDLWPYISNRAVTTTRDGSELVPWLIDSWEVPGDGTEMTLKVRSGVKWHEKPPYNTGRDFDAEDLAFNLMRIAGKLDEDGNLALYQRRTTLEGMDRAEAIDDTTVRVVFDRPASPFMRGVSDHRNYMVPRDFEDNGGNFQDPTTFVGTGPYMITAFQDGTLTTMDRHPNYWKEGLPYLDGIDFQWLADQQAQITALASGQLDVIINADKTARATLNSLAPEVQHHSFEFGSWQHIRFQSERPPFNDPRIRRALRLVLDIESMSNSVHGEGYWKMTGPAPQVFPEAYKADEIRKMAGWNPETKEQDTAEAVKLMAAAGYPDGALEFKILQSSTAQTGATFEYSVLATDRMREVWPAMDAGLTVPTGDASFGQLQANGEFQALCYSIFPVPDLVLELQSHYQSDGSRNYGRYASAEIDDLLGRAFVELDPDARTELLVEVQDKLIEESPTAVLGNPNMNSAWGPQVRNFESLGHRIRGGHYDLMNGMEQVWFA